MNIERLLREDPDAKPRELELEEGPVYFKPGFLTPDAWNAWVAARSGGPHLDYSEPRILTPDELREGINNYLAQRPELKAIVGSPTSY